MSSDRETTRIVRSWLEEGANVLPDRVLDSVLDQIPTTPQRRHPWQAWRNPLVSNTLKFASAGAAALAVAVIGIGLYFNQPGGIGPPAPSPSPTVAPTLEPTLAPTAEPEQSLSGQSSLEPGTYWANASPFFRVSLTVPEGYSAFGDWVVMKDVDGLPIFVATFAAGVSFSAYSDPCKSETGGIITLGPTIDNLITALSGQPGRNPTVPTDVTVAGFEGKRFQLSVPDDLEAEFVEGDDVRFVDCEAEAYRSHGGRYHQGPGQIDDMWILDVEGTRLIINAGYWPDTSAEDVAELVTIVESIERIEIRGR